MDKEQAGGTHEDNTNEHSNKHDKVECVSLVENACGVIGAAENGDNLAAVISNGNIGIDKLSIGRFMDRVILNSGTGKGACHMAQSVEKPGCGITPQPGFSTDCTSPWAQGEALGCIQQK